MSHEPVAIFNFFMKIWLSPDSGETFSKSHEPVAIFNFLMKIWLSPDFNEIFHIFQIRQNEQKCLFIWAAAAKMNKSEKFSKLAGRKLKTKLKNPRRSRPRAWRHPSDALNHLS